MLKALEKKNLFLLDTLETTFWMENVTQNRSSRPEVFCKKGIPRNFTKFIGKHLCQSLSFDIVAGLACNFIKKKTLAQVFSVNFVKLLRRSFYLEHLWATASVKNGHSQGIFYKIRALFCDFQNRAREGPPPPPLPPSCAPMMVISIKQHLGNIWSSIHEKVKQRWDWVEKKCCIKKKRLINFSEII